MELTHPDRRNLKIPVPLLEPIVAMRPGFLGGQGPLLRLPEVPGNLANL